MDAETLTLSSALTRKQMRPWQAIVIELTILKTVELLIGQYRANLV